MDHYDALVIAGDEPYWLSKCLYDLAREVGIPPPTSTATVSIATIVEERSGTLPL